MTKILKQGVLHVEVNAADKTTYLASLLSVAPKAHVMLMKNIDVSDGLVNAVFRTVSSIKFHEDGPFPKLFYVNFDNEEIGKKVRAKFPCFGAGGEKSTPIVADEDTVNNSGGSRRQFPLRLAWACTVHKVQGLTLEKAVVSLKKIFVAGQAYVALSRVTSLENLMIQDFKGAAIYAKNDIEDKLQKKWHNLLSLN